MRKQFILSFLLLSVLLAGSSLISCQQTALPAAPSPTSVPTPTPAPTPIPIFGIIILCIVAWVLWLLLGKMAFRISRAAILATGIPQVVLAVAIYTIGLLFQPLSKIEIGIAQYCLSIGAVIAVLAILSSVIFAIMRKWEIARGTAVSGSIGFVVWVITFALSYGMGLG